jgi:hypothetical protein
MVDPVVFREIMPNNAIVPHIHKPLAGASLTDEQKLVINPLAYGFSLGDKIWGKFDTILYNADVNLDMFIKVPSLYQNSKRSIGTNAWPTLLFSARIVKASSEAWSSITQPQNAMKVWTTSYETKERVSLGF